MTYKVKSVYTDPSRNHTIEETWETNSSDEFIGIMKNEVLDIISNEVFDGGYEVYAEKMHYFTTDNKYLQSEWSRMLKNRKMFQDALVAVSGTDDDPLPHKDTPYVIEVDDNFKVYVTAG